MEALFAFLPRQGAELFFWDPWSVLFVLLILGIGGLITLYAWQYFPEAAAKRKFYSAFFPFMAAMLGVVLFDHLLLLFIAWELTSILSFFLISFKGAYPDARRGALHAALITGAGGLCLLTGILLLGSQSGAWTVSEALEVNLADLPAGGWIGALFVLGAFTKSAQFPFHFWLPGAMSAPTPASAYLHSATMVKAGVYLLFRMEPMLATLSWFEPVLMAFGFATFFLGAVTSIFQMDLKAVLAGTTLANLGLMVALIGAPFSHSQEAVVALVLAHALYKAGLFLFAGIVEHLAETRDLSRISGLGKIFPKTRLVGLALAGANIGLPFTLGYYAKNLLGLPFGWKIALLMGFTLLGKAGLLVAVRPFWGKVAGAPGAHSKAHPPEGLMGTGPVVLGTLSWTLPFFTAWWAPALGLPATPAVPPVEAAMFLALLSCVLAFFLAWVWQPTWVAWWRSAPFPQGARIFDQLWFGHLSLAGGLTRLVQHGRLPLYLAALFALFSFGLVWFLRLPAAPFDFPEGVELILLFLAATKVVGTALLVLSHKPILSVIFVGLVGYSLALTFAFVGAPDLAMTQFSVETLSVLLFVLVLRSLPESREASPPRKLASALFSLGCGLAVGTAVYAAASQPAPSRLREFFGEASLIEAYGRNVVNVILVDFRGLDTLGEITVLALAGYGIYLMLRGRVA